MSKPYLVGEAMTAGYGNGPDILHDCTVSVEPGEIAVIVGPNGAGKTTLFAMVAGFLKADEGEINFENASIVGMKPHQICQRGMVRTFQITQPFAGLTTLQNIMVGAYSNTPQTISARKKAEEVAEVVGMTSLLSQGADGLTVAGRKRLELARALATDPKLLLLDEVMAGLNPAEIDEIVGDSDLVNNNEYISIDDFAKMIMNRI